MTFDLTKLDIREKSEAGVAMNILHPKDGSFIRNSEGQPVTITLKGRNSMAFKNINRVISDRNRERAARGATTNEEEARQNEIDFLCAVTVDWTFTDLDGQPFPPTADNIRKLWSDERFSWVLEQATRFAANDGNFLGI
jgi:hypothetical protein